MTYRSRKLLDAAKEAPRCFGCGRHNDGSVVMAHANWHEYGKGAGMKAHDWAIAALCGECHSAIDQGAHMTKDERKEVWLRAHIRTIGWLFEAGKVVPA